MDKFEIQSKKLGVKRARGYSSVGRAPALQAGCQRFKSAYLHHKPKAKSARTEEQQLASSQRKD